MRNTKKVLVPLATLLAAGAIAVGSGATFTSSSNSTISAVTSGTLKHTNSKEGQAIFDLANIKPGDTVNGALTITNTGSLPATFSLTEGASTSAFGKGFLTLTITDVTNSKPVWAGDFGALVDGTKNDLGVVQPGVATKYNFSVTLGADAPDSEQGKKATATYTWDSVQLTAATVTNQ